MNIKSSIGINLIELKSNSRYAFLYSNNIFSFTIISESNLSKTIERFKNNNVNSSNSTIYVLLDYKKKYFFNSEEKTIENCVGILSDFVDGFIFRNFSDAQEDIDQIILDRLYSDNQYLLYLAVSEDDMKDEVHELINYCRLSGVDGLFFSTREQMLSAGSCDKGDLDIFYSDIKSQQDLNFAYSCGANHFCVTPTSFYYSAFRTLRKLEPATLDKSESE